MKRLIIGLVAVLSLGAIIARANYTATQGSGTTFGSIVVSTTHYAQQLICDYVTPSQCVNVSASGAMTVTDPGVGGTADAAVTAGATGSVSAKLRLLTGTIGTSGSPTTNMLTVQNVGGDNVKFNVQNSAVSSAFVIDTNTATPARTFDVRNLGASQFMVAGNGNVGVGTTNPATKLHVAGSITVSAMAQSSGRRKRETVVIAWSSEGE